MFIGRKAIRRRNLGRGRASRLPRAADLRERPGVSPATLMRWLRVLEALALDAASSRGLSVARTAIVDTASHYFLESERFDRVGIRGRIAVMTLAAAHDDPADPWARAAVLLKSAGRLSDEDARRLRWLDAFGALIANTDRHPYNVVFFTEGATLRLAPAFDQVSMFYAPTADGQVTPPVLALPHPTSDNPALVEEPTPPPR